MKLELYFLFILFYFFLLCSSRRGLTYVRKNVFLFFFFFFFFPSLLFLFLLFLTMSFEIPAARQPKPTHQKKVYGTGGKEKGKKKMSKNSRRAWRPWSRFVNSWRWVRCIAWVSRVPMTVVPVRSFFFLSLFFGYCCCCCSLFFLDLYNMRYISCKKERHVIRLCVGVGEISVRVPFTRGYHRHHMQRWDWW